MERPKVFISHIHEESALAECFKQHVTRDFLGMVDVFVSSDKFSISVGSKWLNEIDEALQSAKIELILCSEDSVSRPWINFEAGAGWVRGIPVVPICHTGMRKADLPLPLNMLDAVVGSNAADLEQLYGLISRELGSSVPKANFNTIATEVENFEREYGLIRKVAVAVQELIVLVPDLHRMFRPDPEEVQATGELPDNIIEKMSPHLDELQELGMVEYAVSTTDLMISAGPTFSGMTKPITIRALEPYYGVAREVAAHLE